MPIPIPTGVANANNTTNINALRLSSSFLKFLLREIPSDMEAGALWNMRPIIIFIVAGISGVSPRAIPSNTAWVLRATSSTTDIILQFNMHRLIVLFDLDSYFSIISAVLASSSSYYLIASGSLEIIG